MNEILTVSDQRLDEMMTHEAKCQSGHATSYDTGCTVTPTHRFRAACNGTEKLVCDGATRAIQRGIGNPTHGCAACHRTKHDCWSVTPA